MIIDSPDILRTWLTRTLSPICDADPAALAKYVMALLKKDKNENELKEFCVDQLDVFLQKETKGFVDQLFTVIGDKSYLTCTATTQSAVQKNDVKSPIIASKDEVVNETLEAEEGHVAEEQHLSTPPPGVPQVAHDLRKPGDIPLETRRRSPRERPRPTRRSPITAPSCRPRISRSRSRDRGRRHGSSDRRDHGSGTSYRAPTTVTSQVSAASTAGDKENRESRHRRLHSPRGARRRSTSRGEKRPRSRELSPLRRRQASGDAAAPETNGDKAPSSAEREKKRRKQRCRDYDEKGFCMRGDSCMYDHGPDPVVVEEMALPRIITGVKPPAPLVDFSQPPPGYVHPPPPGVDHAFVPAAPGVSGATTTPTSSSASASTTTEAYNPEAPSLSSTSTAPPTSAVSTASSLVHTLGAYGAGQMPAAPICYPTAPPPPPAPFTVQYTAPPMTMLQPDLSLVRSRELIALGGEGPTPTLMTSVAPFSGHGPHQRVVFGSGPRGPRPYYPSGGAGPHSVDRTCRTLEVRRIPPHLNTILKLNEHFSQFGQVVNIQICYGGDREAALVSFANRHQALSAYKSTTPVFNNRFVRMFWHTASPVENSGDEYVSDRGVSSIRDRLGPAPMDQSAAHDEGVSQGRDHKAVIISSTGNLTKTMYNPVALKTAAMARTTRRSSEEPPAHQTHGSYAQRAGSIERGKAETTSETQKKQLEIQKAKMTLYDKYVANIKLLFRQMDKCTDEEKKKEITKMLKATQKNLDKISEELKKVQIKPPAAVVACPQKTKEQVERQLLDTELEMINQRQSGSDTTDLNNRLMELRREVMMFNELAAGRDVKGAGVEAHTSSSAATSYGRPRRTSMGTGNRRIPSYANLDKRPRELLISGFNEGSKESLIEHFQTFGVVEDLEFLQQQAQPHHTQSQIGQSPRRALVAYKTRREAEMAMAGGKEFKDGTLDIQWYSRRTHFPSDNDESKGELTAQDLLATLDDEDASSDDNQQGDIDEEVPEIERGWKRRS